MFITAIKENQRVFHPTIRKIGAINSAIAHKINEAVGPDSNGIAKAKISC